MKRILITLTAFASLSIASSALAAAVAEAQRGMGLMSAQGQGREARLRPGFDLVSQSRRRSCAILSRRDVHHTLNSCLPLKITPALGAAIAGQIFFVTFKGDELRQRL